MLYWAYHLVSVILKRLGKKWSLWEIAEFIRIVVGKSLRKACSLILNSLLFIFYQSNFSVPLGCSTWHQIGFGHFSLYLQTLLTFNKECRVWGKEAGKTQGITIISFLSLAMT